MPLLNLDFSNVPDQELMPAGDYLVKVKQCEYRTTKSGYPMLNFQFQVKEGPYEGRVQFYQVPIMPNTMWRVKRDFKAFGIEGMIDLNYDHDPKANKDWVLNDEFFSTDLIITVGEREYEGEKQNEVKALKRAAASII